MSSPPSDAAETRERYARLQDEVGVGVTIVVATKYVDAEGLGALAEAGVAVVGENRAQDLELCHSLSSESAAQKLTIPALVEVNLSGEPTKSGVAPEELPRLLDLYPDVRGLMTMPPLADDPEASRPYFRRLRELAEQHGLRELSMGTSQDYRVAAEEGATYVRVGSALWRG